MSLALCVGITHIYRPRETHAECRIYSSRPWCGWNECIYCWKPVLALSRGVRWDIETPQFSPWFRFWSTLYDQCLGRNSYLAFWDFYVGRQNRKQITALSTRTTARIHMKDFVKKHSAVFESPQFSPWFLFFWSTLYDQCLGWTSRCRVDWCWDRLFSFCWYWRPSAAGCTCCSLYALRPTVSPTKCRKRPTRTQSFRPCETSY